MIAMYSFASVKVIIPSWFVDSFRRTDHESQIYNIMAARPAIAMAPKLAPIFTAGPVNGRGPVVVGAGAEVVTFGVSVDKVAGIGVVTETMGIVTTPGVLTVYGVEPMDSVVGVGTYVVE